MTKPYITTYTGKQFMLLEPTADMISIEDIAHALAMICHFGGHTAQFFSVAQHSVCVAQICPPELQRWGLMHDAAEAYIGDVTRHLKYMMPQYREIEERIMIVIAEKFQLGWPEPLELKALDDAIIQLEAKLLMNGAVLRNRDGSPFTPREVPWIATFYLAPMNPVVARHTFIQEYRRLFIKLQTEPAS